MVIIYYFLLFRLQLHVNVSWYQWICSVAQSSIESELWYAYCYHSLIDCLQVLEKIILSFISFYIRLCAISFSCIIFFSAHSTTCFFWYIIISFSFPQKCWVAIYALFLATIDLISRFWMYISISTAASTLHSALLSAFDILWAQ